MASSRFWILFVVFLATATASLDVFRAGSYIVFPIKGLENGYSLAKIVSLGKFSPDYNLFGIDLNERLIKYNFTFTHKKYTHHFCEYSQTEISSDCRPLQDQFPVVFNSSADDFSMTFTMKVNDDNYCLEVRKYPKSNTIGYGSPLYRASSQFKHCVEIANNVYKETELLGIQRFRKPSEDLVATDVLMAAAAANDCEIASKVTVNNGCCLQKIESGGYGILTIIFVICIVIGLVILALRLLWKQQKAEVVFL